MPRPLLLCSLVLVAASPLPRASSDEPIRYLPLAVHLEAGREAEAADWVARANPYYAPAGVQFVIGTTRALPEASRRLDDNRARHRLASRLVDRHINVFFVDAIRDRWPSAATARASARVGRTPSGWLGGAHIPKPSRRPGSYIIVLGMRDRAEGVAIGLAHELGHVLGSPHHRDPTNIMSYGAQRTGFDEAQLRLFRQRARRLIRRRDVRRIDPGGSRVRPAAP